MTDRSSRLLIIPEIGETGQEKVSNARMLLVGAVGLGCPLAYNFTAAGVGRIGIVDNDNVKRSNLQRQILRRSASLNVNRPTKH
ncbi:MAG: ThiF family adenylyltransferase [Nitrospira sp.]|nr:ThiF family adenylyltransferase [Nitrospira sp.]